MAYKAVVLADSISPDGCRLTTLEITYPRLVHSERLRHRILSNNSASSRAIAILAQLMNMLGEPFMPKVFGVNKSGMQAALNLDGTKLGEAQVVWEDGINRATTTFLELVLGRTIMKRIFGYEPGREYVTRDQVRDHLDEVKYYIPKAEDDFALKDESILNVHKQLASRGLETYIWHTEVISGTSWRNFYGLRDHVDAQPDIQVIAHMMRVAQDASVPRELGYGEWHLPFVTTEEVAAIGVETAKKVSAARSAAVSYNRQHTKKAYEDEVKRYDLLVRGGHLSPLEHQATPFTPEEWELRRNLQAMADRLAHEEATSVPAFVVTEIQQALQFSANYEGWRQLRKEIPNESDFSKIRKE